MLKKIAWFIPIAVMLGVGIWGGTTYLRWKNIDSEAPVVPSYKTYHEAVGTDLPAALAQKAAEAKCGGYILPVDTINGPAPESLREDINLALASCGNWQVLVTDTEREEMKERWENTVKDWGSMMSGRDYQRFLTTQRSVAFQTNYSVRVEFFDSVEHPVDTRKIILSVNDEKTHANIFEISVGYTDAQTIAAWETERQNRLMEIQEWDNRMKTVRIVLLVCAAAVVLSYLILAGSSVRSARRGAGRKKAYLAQIDNREELINNGHYTAALELADNYLSYFPDDITIKAFRERIIVFCGGDTRKAEEAFVHAAKLRSILETTAQGKGRSLSAGERETITALLPYNQSLKESYGQFLAIEDRREGERERRRRELLDTVNARVKEMDPAGARKALGDLEKEAPDVPEATELRKRLSSGPLNILLRRGDGMQTVYCVSKMDIVIGRNDEGNRPDVSIEYNRVSRKHLRLSLVDGKLIAEDLGSANGSYRNGEKIVSSPLEPGDTLNLGKVIDFTVSADEENHGARALHSSELSICFASSPVSFPAGKRRAVVVIKEGLFWLAGEEPRILKPGDSIPSGSYEYRVEEMK